MTLRIKEVEFAGAVARPGGTPPGRLPQIAFSGRSNVGKSSLINRLLGRTRTHVARVSATPGKTQEINFYHVRAALDDTDLEFFLVDLPGYGYARVPKAMRAGWAPLIEGFLKRSEDLIGVVQLVDVRHGPTADDLRMLDFLAAREVPTMVVLTKADKLGRQERDRTLPKVLDKLGIPAEQTILFSSTTGEGRDELLDALAALLAPGE
jgi:GTP-binding protein